jgi:ABC-type lipoprotein export system ATPase subunit
MNNYIKIKNLTKKYDKNKSIKVLNNISFNFEPGKTYSIMGPSGSGKSTLLNLLSLIDNPTAGSIEISNNEIRSNNKVKNDLIRENWNYLSRQKLIVRFYSFRKCLLA